MNDELKIALIFRNIDTELVDIICKRCDQIGESATKRFMKYLYHGGGGKHVLKNDPDLALIYDDICRWMVSKGYRREWNKYDFVGPIRFLPGSAYSKRG